jgi:hypothetical protein
LSPLREGSFFLSVSPCGIQCEKQNRDWHDREIDDETGDRNSNGTKPSEQIAEDRWTNKRHCWRRSCQRGECAGAHIHVENDTGKQKHHTVEANDGDAQGDDHRYVLTECPGRRGNGSGKKRQRHGIKQHHPIQG